MDQALRGEIVRLKDTLRHMEWQQERLLRQRRRRLLVVGIAVSMVVHLVLMWYLATHYRLRPGNPGPQAVSYEFAILQEESLTELEALELDELQPAEEATVEDLAEESPAALEPAVAAADLEVTGAGALPSLSGAGSGEGGGGNLGGGAAGTSFFGVSSRGRRFAFIVDRSGSMGENRKMQVAMRELANSVSMLPDYASFYVVLFSSSFVEPPMQNGWMQSRKPTVNRFIKWLGGVDPSGGTVPMPAFYQVFVLDERPDVIFFLTDGEIPEDTADLVADLNRRGGRVVINTIAFGSDANQTQLRRIATESGGIFKYVRTGGP